MWNWVSHNWPAVLPRSANSALESMPSRTRLMTMPERPSTFVPVDEQRIVQHTTPGRERPAPRYSPEDLARCMPRYSVERGRLLRNGMQEFLFKL